MRANLLLKLVHFNLKFGDSFVAVNVAPVGMNAGAPRPHNANANVLLGADFVHENLVARNQQGEQGTLLLLAPPLYFGKRNSIKYICL